MSISLTDPRTPLDPPIDLRAHPRPTCGDIRRRRCPAVFLSIPPVLVMEPHYTTTDPVAQTRRCGICDATKPLTSYSLNKTDGLGHGHICSSCNAEIWIERKARMQRGELLIGVNASVRERLAARRAAERERA